MTQTLAAPGAALIDARDGLRLAGDDLSAAIAEHVGAYGDLPPGVIFARIGLDLPSVLRYLGSVGAGRPIALLDPTLDPATLANLVSRFEPAALIGLTEGSESLAADEPPAGYRRAANGQLGPFFVREQASVHQPHPDLGVLLATSGSTGSAKLVRLSRNAVRSNALSIAEALEIGADAVAPTSLPLFYSYGLSVLNSHLVAGATVLLADGGVLAQPFWAAFDEHKATSLAGVPYHYEMLKRIRWNPKQHPSLRSMTQAGGRLRVELIEEFHELALAAGCRFQPMYGQTEATARITIMPAGLVRTKLGSPGVAIPGGTLSVRLDDGTETTEAGVTGEVLYRGPNVMLGYAETAADFALGDTLGGVLLTGDIGHLDEDGFLYLTGRTKRIGKIFGVRVNLDDIESMVTRLWPVSVPVAVVPAGDKVVVWCEGEFDRAHLGDLQKLLADRLRLHRSGFDVRPIANLPQLPSGKIDYRSLEGQS